MLTLFGVSAYFEVHILDYTVERNCDKLFPSWIDNDHQGTLQHQTLAL